jgi:uncharacterized membrane protein
MTKYEWEKELRRNIQSLPADEVARILDYYSELFEDKAETGMSEKAIVNEFGNPFDVARKIINEFEGDAGATAGTGATAGAGATAATGAAGHGGAAAGDPNRDVIYHRAERGDDTLGVKILAGVKSFGEAVGRGIDEVADGIKKVFAKKPPLGAKTCGEPYGNFDAGSNADPDAGSNKDLNAEPDAGSNADPNADPNVGSNADPNVSPGADAAGSETRQAADALRDDGGKAAADAARKLSETPSRRSGCPAAFVKVLAFLPFIIFSVVCFSVTLSLLLGGIGVIAAGVAQGAVGIAELARDLYVGLTKLGFGLGAAGVGTALSAVSLCGVRLCARMVKYYFGNGRRQKKEIS